jgi:hypothetical protein
MTLTALMNRPMVIVRRTAGETTDAFGNNVSAEASTPVLGELQQQQRTEPLAEGELSDTRWIVFLPASTDLSTGDAIVCDGHIYELVGDPWEVRNPRTQTESHVEATVRRTDTADETSS